MTEETGALAHPDTPDDAARAAALEARLAELESATRAQVIRAELKAEAVRAGMVDLDGLKLIDPTPLALNAAGEVEGAAQLMAAMKREKPWLFGRASSSSTAAAPPSQPAQTRRATEMSYAEWQAARQDLLKRR